MRPPGRIHADTRDLLRKSWREAPPSRFLDYRDFLRELHRGVEGVVGRYPMVRFSRDLGLAAGNTAYMVLHGYRRLSHHQTETLCGALGVTGIERKFLQKLREYADCKDESARASIFQGLVSLKEQVTGSDHDRLMLQFFADWHHAALFEMIGLPDFRSDPEWIASRFFRPITADEVKKSLELLQTLGLVVYDEAQAKHIKTQANLTVGPEVAGLGAVGFHLQMLALAQNALSQIAADEREIGALTLAVDASMALRLKEDLRLFKKYVVFLSEQCRAPDRLLQLNFQLFPITRAEEG